MKSTSREVIIGIDVGTTTTKAVAIDESGDVVGSANAVTTWDIGVNGEVQTDIDRLTDSVIMVLVETARSVGEGTTVAGIGITGMAEVGVVVSSAGEALTPAMAWYDQRGAEELAALPQGFRDEFISVTGLAAKAECSFAKLLWLGSHGGPSLAGTQWLNALEYIAFRLTGVRASEPSLASRTGLLDQGSITPWATTLDIIGAKSSFIPELVVAGTSLGPVVASGPAMIRGAAVTVAGHDHLVGSVGAGAVGGDDLFDSCGTADVILRTVPRTLTNADRSHLVGRGLSAGRHVLAGSTAILGATRSGLVLGRVMSMLGAHDRAARQQLADTWRADREPSARVLVSEPSGWTNEVTVRLRDDATPIDVWTAATEYVLAQTAELLEAVAEVAGPYETAIAAGGWAHVTGVYRGKAHVMPGLIVSDVQLPGATGAAMFAAQAAGVSSGPISPQAPSRPAVPTNA
jgi:sugar (pentulose or hexulose) kinase